jgi:hypothetical protein
MDGPLFSSKVSSKCLAIMFAIKRTAGVPGLLIVTSAGAAFRRTMRKSLQFGLESRERKNVLPQKRSRGVAKKR